MAPVRDRRQSFWSQARWCV